MRWAYSTTVGACCVTRMNDPGHGRVQGGLFEPPPCAKVGACSRILHRENRDRVYCMRML